MVISNDTARFDELGNGSTTTFPYPFRIDAEDEITVTVVDSDNNSVLLAFGTDYILTGVGDSAGGDVDTTGLYGAVAIGSTISGVRNIGITQETDLQSQGDLSPEVIELTFDRQVMMLQQQQEVQSRCLKIDAGFAATDALTTLVPEADTVIGWNDDATGLENKAVGSIDLAIPADGSVTTDKLGALAVTAAKIAADAVTTAKILDGNVTAAKLAATVVSALTEETALALADEFPFSDTSAGALRKITPTNFLKIINLLTADGSPDKTADYVVTYDASASTVKKVLLQNLVGQGDSTTLGTIKTASAAQVTTGTMTDGAITPATAQAHLSAAKAWVVFTVSGGTVTVRDSYNVTSITDNGPGDFTVNFTTSFATAYYASSMSMTNFSNEYGMGQPIDESTPPTASAFRFNTQTFDGTKTDMDYITCTFHGKQA